MIRVLLVDNHSGLRKVVRRVLERDGDVEVVGESEDGTQALRDIEALKPDIVILDILMPRMNGYQVLDALREQPTPPKVIMLTMNESDSARKKALAGGASGYVTKKLAFTDLLSTVRLAHKG